jgi:hypothetical protein
VVTGFGVNVLILSRIGLPQPDDRDAVRGDEDRGVSAATGTAEHVEVVFDLLDVNHLRRIRRGLRVQRSESANRDQQAEYDCSSHDFCSFTALAAHTLVIVYRAKALE